MRTGAFLISLFLILIGVVSLLINLGYGSWRLFHLLPYIWPTLLIVLGLALLWKGHIPFWFALLITVILTGSVIAIFLNTPQNNGLPEEEEFSIRRFDYPQLSAGELKISFGAGQLYLGAGASDWFEGRFTGLAPVEKVTVSNDRLQLQVEPEEGVREGWFRTLRFRRWSKDPDRSYGWRMDAKENRWDLEISTQLPWSIEIQTGAVQGRFDLKGVPLTRFDLKSGAGDLEIRMGNNGPHSKLKIDAGLSKLRFLLPKNTGLRIDLHGALTETNLGKTGFLVNNQRYLSPNYQTATEKVDLDLNLAVGQFELEWITTEDIACSLLSVSASSI